MVLSEHEVANIITGLDKDAAVPINSHKLKQRYIVVRKLGQGTYGKVQLAINKETKLEVAIKTIKKKRIETEQDLLRIRREIQILSSVTHPHIVHIYEVFENRDKMVLVMEYAAGGELFDFLSERQCLSDEEARRIFRQIVSACYYCHQNNICHRDLKLENILLDEFGNAKIADFGLSTLFSRDAALSTYCGSPLYASPEIVSGTPYRGPEVDCWSLGVLLYTLVYGAMPFDGSNFKRLVKQITTGRYYEPKPAASASDLISRLLTVRREKRISIGEVCRHWWVNKDCQHCCLLLSRQLCEQTPVRLDLLLSVAADSLPESAPTMRLSSEPAERVDECGAAEGDMTDMNAEASLDEDMCESEGELHNLSGSWYRGFLSGLNMSRSDYSDGGLQRHRLRSIPPSHSLITAAKRRRFSDHLGNSSLVDSIFVREGSMFVLTSRSNSVRSLPCQGSDAYCSPLVTSLSLPSCHHPYIYENIYEYGLRRQHSSRAVEQAVLADRHVGSDEEVGPLSLAPGESPEPSLAALRLKSSRTVAGIWQGVSRSQTAKSRPIGYKLAKVMSWRGGATDLRPDHRATTSNRLTCKNDNVVLPSQRASETSPSSVGTRSSGVTNSEFCESTFSVSDMQSGTDERLRHTMANKPLRQENLIKSRDLQSASTESADKSMSSSQKPVYRSELSIELSRRGSLGGGREAEADGSRSGRLDSSVNRPCSVIHFSDSSIVSDSSEGGSIATGRQSVTRDGAATVISLCPKPLRKSHREVIIPIVLEDGGSIMPSAECAASSDRCDLYRAAVTNQRVQDPQSTLSSGQLGHSYGHMFSFPRRRSEDADKKMTRISQQRLRPEESSVYDYSSDGMIGSLSRLYVGSDSDSSDGEPEAEPFSLCTADSLFSTMLHRVQNLSRQMRVNSVTGFRSSLLPLCDNRSANRHAALTYRRPRSLQPILAKSDAALDVLRHQDGTFISYQHVNIPK